MKRTSHRWATARRPALRAPTARNRGGVPSAADLRDRPAGLPVISRKGSNAYQGEKNAQVSGYKATGQPSSRGVYEAMLTTNPVAATGYMAMVAALQSAEYITRADQRCPQAIQDYVNELLFERPDRRFKQMQAQLWRAIPQGVAPQEIVSFRQDGLWWLRDVQERPLRTFDYGRTELGADGWVRSYQMTLDPQFSGTGVKMGGPADAGAGWLWWVTWGSGMMGEPSLRPVWAENAAKDDIRRVLRIAVQKVLLGPALILMHEPSANFQAPEPDDALLAKTESELGDVIYDEKGVYTAPDFVKDVKQLFGESESITKAIEAENHLDIQILMAFHAQWLARGLLSAYGSNAASKTDSAEQRNVRRHIFDWAIGQWQRIINYYVELNFGPQIYVPELVAIYRSELDQSQEVANWTKLRTAGGLSVGDADEDYLRRAHGWPERQDGNAPRIVAGTTEPETPGTFDETTGEDERERPSEGDYT